VPRVHRRSVCVCVCVRVCACWPGSTAFAVGTGGAVLHYGCFVSPQSPAPVASPSDVRLAVDSGRDTSAAEASSNYPPMSAAVAAVVGVKGDYSAGGSSAGAVDTAAAVAAAVAAVVEAKNAASGASTATASSHAAAAAGLAPYEYEYVPPSSGRTAFAGKTGNGGASSSGTPGGGHGGGGGGGGSSGLDGDASAGFGGSSRGGGPRGSSSSSSAAAAASRGVAASGSGEAARAQRVSRTGGRVPVATPGPATRAWDSARAATQKKAVDQQLW
jgi:hypothetical protein